MRLARLAMADELVPWVDPAAVRRPVDWQVRHQLGGDGRWSPFVRTGDWDAERVGFDDDPRHRAMRELVDADLRYEETRTYAEMLDDLAAGRPADFHTRVLDSRAAVDRYWERRVALVRSMRDEGYDTSMTDDDPGVAIGRGGEPLKLFNGNHRFAVARVLGLSPMPVRVLAVHASWVEDVLTDGRDLGHALRQHWRRLESARSA